jgi:hypothetical protein
MLKSLNLPEGKLSKAYLLPAGLYKPQVKHVKIDPKNDINLSHKLEQQLGDSLVFVRHFLSEEDDDESEDEDDNDAEDDAELIDDLLDDPLDDSELSELVFSSAFFFFDFFPSGISRFAYNCVPAV